MAWCTVSEAWQAFITGLVCHLAGTADLTGIEKPATLGPPGAAPTTHSPRQHEGRDDDEEEEHRDSDGNDNNLFYLSSISKLLYPLGYSIDHLFF
ncbi:hypothetical protein E2C01_083442 [Portunus trituberculatus]|uniref:Uncharacterized protein n=1 Tax=Portunus trituberculatus TaxID=210409 RepID=A0A5B7J805_PORTR|nr:hypothetical protein [Portunus trituberculatus]